MNILRKSILLIITLTFFKVLMSDVAPAAIYIKSLRNTNTCEVQMLSEDVNIRITRDTSYVDCSFNLKNHGVADTIEIGFPVMNFHHWKSNGGYYGSTDLKNFQIFIGSQVLSMDEIRAPEEMDSIYNAWMNLYEFREHISSMHDSIYEKYGVTVNKRGRYKHPAGTYQQVDKANDSIRSLWWARWRESSALRLEFDKKMEHGHNLWYVWDVSFDSNEMKTINVSYKLPIGYGFESGTVFNYMKYLLNTGNGWKGDILDVNINITLENIKMDWIEDISPEGYMVDIDSKSISWELHNLEPTTDDDIYVRYYIPIERRKYERYQRKKARKIEKLKRKGLIN